MKLIEMNAIYAFLNSKKLLDSAVEAVLENSDLRKELHVI